MLKCKRFEGETATEMARRVGCPVCMLLRANGVFSASWLETAWEAVLPDENTCTANDFPCPKLAVKAEIPQRIGYIVKKGDTAFSIARKFGLPVRLVHSIARPIGLRTGAGLWLPERERDMKIITVRIDTTWRDIENAPSVMLLNNHFSRLYPGMKLLIRG